MQLKTLILLAGMTAMSFAWAENDPYLWLEEVEGKKALEWATEQSAATSKILEARPEFEPIRSRTLEILDSKDQSPKGL